MRALSERQVKARSLEVLSGKGGLGGFVPDPGRAYNPGQDALWRQPGENARAVSGQPDWKHYRRPDARKLPKAPSPELLPRADTAEKARRAVEEALGLSDSPVGRIVKTPVEDVLLDRERVSHITAKFRDHRERYANRKKRSPLCGGPPVCGKGQGATLLALRVCVSSGDRILQPLIPVSVRAGRPAPANLLVGHARQVAVGIAHVVVDLRVAVDASEVALDHETPGVVLHVAAHQEDPVAVPLDHRRGLRVLGPGIAGRAGAL